MTKLSQAYLAAVAFDTKPEEIKINTDGLLPYKLQCLMQDCTHAGAEMENERVQPIAAAVAKLIDVSLRVQDGPLRDALVELQKAIEAAGGNDA